MDLENNVASTNVPNTSEPKAPIYESDDPAINPSHYKKGDYEVIDIIGIFTSDLVGIVAVDTGNVIKYSCRWYRKNGIQDVEKIIWYAKHLKETLKYIPEIEEFREIPFRVPVSQIEDISDIFAPSEEEATDEVINLSKNIILRAISWVNENDVDELIEAATQLRDLLKEKK